MSLNVCVLGSSSKGNATVIWNDDGALMIDCGLYVRETQARLEQIGLELRDLSAALITHAHGDHLYPSMLNALRRESVPVYLHRETAEYAASRHSQVGKTRSKGLLETFLHAPFEAGPFRIEPFPVVHDDGFHCVGYSVLEAGTGGGKVTVATDLGTTDGLFSVFRDSDIIVLESNHDVEMERNSGRPWDLIQRVFRSHLSNDDCACFLRDLAAGGTHPKAVFLAHISQECNTNELAESTVSRVLTDYTQTFLTFPDRISGVSVL